MSPANTPPLAFVEAARQFNAHQFWECHETLEPLWLNSQGSQKLFLQGLIQIAAGFVHVSNTNFKGAVSKLSAGLEKLQQVQPDPALPGWMDLAGFIAATQSALHMVKQLGPERLNRFCPGQYPPWKLICE